MVRTQQDTGREARDNRGPESSGDVARDSNVVAEVPKEIADDWRIFGWLQSRRAPYNTRPQDVHPSDIPVGLVAYDFH